MNELQNETQRVEQRESDEDPYRVRDGQAGKREQA